MTPGPGPFHRIVAQVHGSGPPVVLLHGQPGTAADWSAVVPRLSDDFTVIAVDRPGWGRTGGPAGGFATNAAAVLDFLDASGIDEAIVVGHSWGGPVALALAQAAPARISGLVLVGSVAPGQVTSRFDRLLGAPTIGDLAVPLAFGLAGRLLSSPHALALLERSSMRNYAKTALAALVEARREGRSRGSNLRSGRAFTVEQRSFLTELDDLGPGMSNITAPAEVLCGGDDRIVPAAVARLLCDSLPDAVLRLVTGAGHLVPLEHPNDVAVAVRSVARRATLSPHPRPAAQSLSTEPPGPGLGIQPL